ncbi:MAG: SIS domain-containing protein [Armatimonadetes bacterium]|nr:SIS domain-containing protein [Armatimonadota bacterium]
MSMIKDYLSSLTTAIAELPEDKVQDVIDTLKAAHAEGRQVFLLGNGGSAATASHIACDFQKGLKECTGKRFKAASITDNVSIMTAWANDTDYDNIFAQQLDSLLEPGDVVIAISGSGNSPNIIKAVERANQMGAITVGWSGFKGGKLAQIVQKPIVVNSDNMQRIEDVHMILGHLVFACLMKQCDKA